MWGHKVYILIYSFVALDYYKIWVFYVKFFLKKTMFHDCEIHIL
jgi:hypothetical protein